MKKILFLLIVLLNSLFAIELQFTQLTDIYQKKLSINIDDSIVNDFIVDIPDDTFSDVNDLKSFYNQLLYDNQFLLVAVTDYNYNIVRSPDYNFVDIDNNITIQEPTIFDSHIYSIKNITNEDLESVLEVFGDALKYKYLPQTNRLIYYCDDTLADRVYNALQQLDLPTKQAQVKITIMINDNALLKDFGSNINNFGLDFDLQKTFTDFFTKGVSSSYSSEAFFRFNTLVRFMETAGVTSVEQSPTLLLKNGTKSTLKSVKTVPYISSTTQVTDTKESTTESVQYKDIGLQLEIIPKISNDSIFLNISLISEELLDMNDNKPITQKVEYQNSVYLKDKPVLLTGIVKKSDRSTVVGVPLLKDIPILGHIFKHTDIDNSTQTISILIERR